MIPLAAPDLSGNERKYLLQAFDSGYLTHVGEFEDRFEREFGKWIGRPALSTSSGTSALHLSLLSLGIGPGDEVICPALTFGATASVIVRCGAKPVFVDVEENFCINWKHAISKINRRTKAVIAVHLYGEQSVIPKCPVPVIEDSCEALGIVEPTQDYACFSFYGNKVMTTGEGGMLVGNTGLAKQYRDGGFTKDYDMLVAGLNYRMTNIQAAIGCAQLERIDDLVEKRLRNAQQYADSLEGKGKWLFVVKSSNPAALQEHLKEAGIDSRPVFRPLHMTQAFRCSGKFSQAEEEWSTGLCLPTGPHLGESHIEAIIERIKEWHSRHTRTSGQSLPRGLTTPASVQRSSTVL